MNPNDPILNKLRAGDCPGVDLLESYRLHPEQQPAVQAHLKTCAACQAELDLLHSFQNAAVSSAQEEADVEWVVNLAKSRSHKDRKSMRSWWTSLFAGGMKAWAGAAVAAVLVVALSVHWNASRLPEPPREITGETIRAGVTGRIEVLEPAAGTLSTAPAQIRWQAVDGAQKYEVMLLEVDGAETPLGSTSAAVSLQLGEENRKLFLPHKTVGIRIRARAADGRILAESQEIRIRIEP